MKKTLAGLLVLLLTGAATLHYLRLDGLLWHTWRLSLTPPATGALNLGRYRVEIEAQPITGLDDDISALTYNTNTNTLFAVLNSEPWLVELSLDGVLLRKVLIRGLEDLEGLTHVDDQRYVIAEEQHQRLWLIHLADEAIEIDSSEAPSVGIGLDMNGNKGFEGLSWDGQRQRLLVVKERDPLRVLSITGFVDAKPSQPMTVQISEVKSPHSSRLFVRDLSSLTVHDESGHLLLLSDESHMLVEYAEDGAPVSLLGLWRGMSGLRRTVPQAEGVALDSQQRLYLVSEPNLFYRFVPVR